jgi:ABC-2 type transport system ATP-binding protein
MGQRLGIATALLADPDTLILDEPVNGLDPEGIRWIRELLRNLAAEGRTVLISSHLMSEMAVTADHVLVLGRGRLLADLPMTDLLAQAASNTVLVRTPQPEELTTALVGIGASVTRTGPDLLEVTGPTAAGIGDLARDLRISVHGLTPRQVSLEEAYMDMTRDAVEFHASTTTGPVLDTDMRVAGLSEGTAA